MKKTVWACLAIFVASGAAYAQGGAPPEPPPGPPHEAFGPGGWGFGMRPGKVVTGAPYSATVTDSVTQKLADGNTIQRTTTAQVARDSQGRTYEQLTITGGPFAQNGPTTLTFLTDPVAGYTYVLNPNTKVAERRAIRVPGANGAAPPAGPRGPRTHGRDSANRVETDLGTQVINGVTAQGKSVTHTIPAGEIGNSQPIVSTIETWYSPDLQIPVLSKRSDPRMGQSVYAVTNIQRSEPAASLFQVPSDYTVKDAPARGPRGPREPMQ